MVCTKFKLSADCTVIEIKDLPYVTAMNELWNNTLVLH